MKNFHHTKLSIKFMTVKLSILAQPLKNLVRKIENVKKDGRDKPLQDVVISDCGSLPLEEAFHVPKQAVKE